MFLRDTSGPGHHPDETGGTPDGTAPMTDFDLAGETSDQVAPSLNPTPLNPTPRSNRRPEPRDDIRQDVRHRYGAGSRNRNPVPWPTGPTQPLPSLAAEALVTRPAIPAARGEPTVELPVAPVSPPPMASAAPASAPPGSTTPSSATPSSATPSSAVAGNTTAGNTSAPGDVEARDAGVAPARPRQRTRPGSDESAADSWELVVRAQDGDTDAFAQIYNKYLDAVFRFIYFRVTNRQVAEDLTAETFLRALKRIGSVTWQGRDIGAWLITIARNLVADHFKSGRYRLEMPTGDVLDADAEERGPEGSPEIAVVEHITNVTLLSAVQQLNPEQRECIVLRFLKGFSVAETAQAMGKNEGAIKALQYRAVRALQRLLPEGFQG